MEHRRVVVAETAQDYGQGVVGHRLGGVWGRVGGRRERGRERGGKEGGREKGEGTNKDRKIKVSV